MPNFLKVFFIFFGLVVFQITVVTVLASRVNLGFDPYHPISETYTCGKIEGSACVKAGRTGGLSRVLLINEVRLEYEVLADVTSVAAMEEIKALFYKMVDASPELKDFIKDKSAEFTLCFDDYGKGSIGLCSEKEKKITWEADIK